MIKDKEMLRKWNDPLTAIEILQRMKDEYESNGYEVKMKLHMLRIFLDDGEVMIYWRDGAIWQEIVAYD